MNAAAGIARALTFGYRPRGGVLQRARATTSCGWFAALGLVIVLYENPLVSAVVLGVTLIAAVRCRVLREVLLAVAVSAPLAVLVALINPIASQQGLTVLVADLRLPLVGSIEITREAVVYGLILGLRALAMFAVCALYVCTVDPDQLLRVLRRRSVRSAITASLAVRFVPVLARDGARLAEARSCRPGIKPGAAAVSRAVFARSLDRAGDAALALETRGYALAVPLREAHRPRRRVDWAVSASAMLVAVIAIVGKSAGLASFSDYPLTQADLGPWEIVLILALGVTALAPFTLPTARLDGSVSAASASATEVSAASVLTTSASVTSVSASAACNVAAPSASTDLSTGGAA
ncbi:MAG: energy-coupling factor transporter transmembrane protein EcfT [Actinobacteria bacterium]|nr:energy-coupling factor transporter transmembrane protein EcfT [Actinomycetota bacterium]